MAKRTTHPFIVLALLLAVGSPAYHPLQAGEVSVHAVGEPSPGSGRLPESTRVGGTLTGASVEAYYPFDVDSLDHSSHGRHATLEGAATIGNGIIGGGALDLTGGDGWADIVDPVLSGFAECTLAYWIRINALEPGSLSDCCDAIFVEDEFLPNALHNNVTLAPPEMIEWVISTSSIDATIPAPTPIPSNWMHLALTYEQASGTKKVYVNGELADTFVSAEQIPCGSGQSSQIGAWWNGTEQFRFLDASVDEVWIFSRALGDEEIRALGPLVFADGFESGDTSAWSTSFGQQ